MGQRKAQHLRCAAHAEAGDGAKLAVVPDVERVIVHIGAPQAFQRSRTPVYLRACDTQGIEQICYLEGVRHSLLGNAALSAPTLMDN